MGKYVERIIKLSNETGYDVTMLMSRFLEMLENEDGEMYSSVFGDFEAITMERDW